MTDPSIYTGLSSYGLIVLYTINMTDPPLRTWPNPKVQTQTLLATCFEGNYILGKPVARIFARGVTRVSDVYLCMYNDAKVGGSGGMLPQEIFRSKMLLDCF